MSNLKATREDKKLSQSQLANKSGVSVRMIQSYEQGAKDINKTQGITLYKLSQALWCKIEDILNLEGVE